LWFVVLSCAATVGLVVANFSFWYTVPGERYWPEGTFVSRSHIDVLFIPLIPIGFAWSLLGMIWAAVRNWCPVYLICVVNLVLVFAEIIGLMRLLCAL
jgi:hypothetical protein